MQLFQNFHLNPIFIFSKFLVQHQHLMTSKYSQKKKTGKIFLFTNLHMFLFMSFVNYIYNTHNCAEPQAVQVLFLEIAKANHRRLCHYLIRPDDPRNSL